MRRVPLTRRQLGATRGRTAAGMVGIAVGILLILALQGIFAGMEARLTAFVDATEADVVVAQRGVTATHGSESSLPASVVGQIETLPGVEPARSIVFVSTAIRNGKRQAISYFTLGRARAERSSSPDDEDDGPAVRPAAAAHTAR